MPERDESESAEHAAPLRFGPNRYWYGMVVLAFLVFLVLLVFTLLGLMTGAGGSGRGFGAVVAFGGLSAFALTGVLGARTVFFVCADGLRQKKGRKRRFAPWSALAHVGNQDIGMGGVNDDPNIYGNRGRMREGSTDPTAFVFLVFDRRGYVAFRIPPWIARRRELVREIQRHIREA